MEITTIEDPVPEIFPGIPEYSINLPACEERRWLLAKKKKHIAIDNESVAREEKRKFFVFAIDRQ